LVNKGGIAPDIPICHSFITNGRIRYENDSSHQLKGQIIDLPDLSGL
jgi:hypothetical protein